MYLVHLSAFGMPWISLTTNGSLKPNRSGPLIVTTCRFIGLRSLILLHITIYWHWITADITQDAVADSLTIGLSGFSDEVTWNNGFDPPSIISQVYFARSPNLVVLQCSLVLL